jgi:uncharacterized protein YuzE
VRLLITYNTEMRAAYVAVGDGRRPVASTILVSEDDGVTADLDEHGMIIGIELLDVQYPVVELTGEPPPPHIFRGLENVDVKEDRL